MREILVFFLLIILVSCRPTPKIETVEEYIPPIADTFKIDTPKVNIKPIALITPDPPSAYELNMQRKMKNIISGAQFLRKYFARGNLSSQVIKVQGFPNDKVNMGDYTEVWFYGDCEVTIYNGVVKNVKNSKDCLSYIDFMICADSDDKQVQQNTVQILQELAKNKLLH